MSMPHHTQIATLLFPKEVFTPAAARRWALSHGFHVEKTDTGSTKARFLRIRQHAPSHYKPRSFRTIALGDSVEAVIGLPRDARKNPCVEVKSPMGSFQVHAATRYEAERVAERMRKEHQKRKLPAEIHVHPNPKPYAASKELRKLVNEHGGAVVASDSAVSWFAFLTRKNAIAFFEAAVGRGYRTRAVVEPPNTTGGWVIGVNSTKSNPYPIWSGPFGKSPMKPKKNPNDVSLLAIRRAVTAAGFPGISIRKGTGSIKGAVQVSWPHPLPDPTWTARASLWLKVHYPDVPFIGIRPQAFIDYWIGRPGTNIVGFAKGVK